MALLLDALLCLILFGITIASLFALGETNEPIKQFLITHMDLIVLVLPLLTISLYSIAMEASHLRATLGKLALGIKVCDAHGRRAALPVITFREAIKYPCCLFHLFTRGARLPFVTYDASLPSPLLHDVLTRTCVLGVKRHRSKPPGESPA